MKRLDLLEAAKLLDKHKLPATDATLFIATQYAEGWRLGEITVPFKEWLDEDMVVESEDDLSEIAGEVVDPTGTPGSEPSTTTWPRSVSSTQDSTQQPTGT